MKNFFRTVAYGAAGAIGYLLGVRIFNMFTDPYKKARWKKKFKNVKKALKDE